MTNQKNNFYIIFFAIINALAGILLTIFAFPNQIPTLVDFSEKVFTLGTKWLMLLCVIIPTAIALSGIFTKNAKLSKIFKAIFVLSLYENMLLYSCFSLKSSFAIGELIEIPLSTFLFIPLSVMMMIYGIKIKHIAYASKLGIRTKSTLETEFIWKQMHFLARDVIFATGFILFLLSIVSSFFHYFYIMLIVFVVAIIIDLIIILSQAKSMQKKYLYMKNRQDMVNKQTEEKTAKETENQTTKK